MEGDPIVSRAQFAELVQDALAHLYDNVHLQQHPLARLLAAGPSASVRGRTLHRLLLEAIGQLKPSRDLPHFSTAWRKYQYFILRYVEGRSALDAADELAISERQSRRYHREALEATVSVLWELHQSIADSNDHVRDAEPATNGSGGPGGWTAMLKDEIARLAGDSRATSVALPDVLGGVISAVTNLADSKGVQVTLSLDEGLPTIAMDRVALRQVLFSVLTYVLQHTDHHAVNLQGTTNLARECIELRVETDAASIPVGESPSAESTERLEAARHLLADANGSLEIRRDDARMVRLALTFPRACPTTVLVIDDNPDMVRMFRRFLSGRSYHVLTATNGATALDIARQSRLHAVTLDVMMPAQDGWDTLQMLRSIPATRNVPIVVCSVLRERELALSLGATDFLAKPITQQALLTTLDRHLTVASR